MVKDSGYLLSYVRYGDNDAILHCFTKDNGFQSYFVRGIYSANSKKKAYLAPLNELTFVVNDFQKSGLATINKIESVVAVDTNDVRTSSVMFFVAEFLHQVLKTETRQEQIYNEISYFLRELSQGDFQSHYQFLINFLKIQGLAPLVSDGQFLDPELGSFENLLCHQMFNHEISACWKLLLSENYGVKLPKDLKSDFLDSILLYYMHHFPNFKFPKSLEVLKDIFY